MFGGETRSVELQFAPEMLDDMYDKFGEQIRVGKTDKYYVITFTIQISPTFFSWVAGSRGKVRILSPYSVKERFAEFVKEIKENY